MTDVWAIDLLPVVQQRKPQRPGPSDTWTEDQLALLVDLRENKRKEWGEIGRALQRPLKSCHRRYAAIVRNRQPLTEPAPAPLSADAPCRRRSLHEEMGLRTFSVSKTMVQGVRIRRIEVTLSAGFARRDDD